jgi:very-short-patch-repair endonuclease
LKLSPSVAGRVVGQAVYVAIIAPRAACAGVRAASAGVRAASAGMRGGFEPTRVDRRERGVDSALPTPLDPMDDVSQRTWDEMPAWPDREIAQLAGRQRTIVSHAQLIALGVRPRTIGAALDRGRLHRVHHGVHSLVVAQARPLLAAEQAALLACGPRAVLSHRTAAHLHGLSLPGRASEIDVTVIAADRRRPAITIHRTRRLGPGDRTRVNRLPVTSIARTILDLSATLPPRTLEHLLDQGLRRTSATKLREALARHPGRAGTAQLRLLLDPERPSSETWSVAEERLRRLILRAGLPAPELNVALGDYIPDLLWREHRVIVEFDSRRHHSGPVAKRRDARRHNDLTVQRFQVLHVTWQDLVDHPERVLVWVAVGLAAAGWAP